MSLTQRWHAPAATVRVGGEFDRGGKRGFVSLACSPSTCLLTRGAARDVARTLIRFAEGVRPAPRKKPA